ncbi:MAG: siphovirus ReqiPepy6 Gp37-like family protein [Saccharofermentanales bacterium]|jgi:hypothetical protein
MIAPNIRVLDKNFNLLATLDSYTSFQGERSLWEVGTCELHIGLRNQGANKLQAGVLISIDPHRVWEINNIKLTEDKDLKLVASGKELKTILKQRLIVPDKKNDTQHFGFDRFPNPEDPDATAETIMKYYVNKHAVNPDDPKRKLPRLNIAVDRQRGLKTRWSERFKSIVDCFKDIGEFAGIGYEVYLDHKNKEFIFDVIPERIQTIGSDNPVVFSRDYNNIANLNYTLDTSEDVTVAYAGGYGTDEDRLIQLVARNEEDMNLSGYNRKESWIDVASSQTVDDLIYEAQHQLSKKEKKETLSSNAIPNVSFEYLKNWDIGSIVTVESRRLGFMQNKKITAVKEVYERNKVEITPTFGKRNLNILDEIRKTEVIR